MGLTTEYGIFPSQISKTLMRLSQGDIDVFLDRSCYWMLPEVKNLSLVPTSEYMSGCPNSSYTHMPVWEWDEVQRDFAAVFEGLPTNVQVGQLCESQSNHHPPPQFILVPEVRRVRGQASAKRCGRMEGEEFAMNILRSFDLDLARNAIFNSKYISCFGGIDTCVAFFEESELLYLELDTLVWSDRSWRGMTEDEKQLKRLDTKARVKKYVARLEYRHFIQYTKPLEEASAEEFWDMQPYKPYR